MLLEVVVTAAVGGVAAAFDAALLPDAATSLPSKETNLCRVADLCA